MAPSPKVNLAIQPIPKSLVRVGAAGDFVKNLALGSLSDTDIRNIQQGVAEGVIERIVVTGIDAYSIPRERFWMRFDPLTDDIKIELDLEGGKSILEAVDVGLAASVATAVNVLKRKALRPRFYFEWSQAARANPARLDEAKQRLGFQDSGPLPLIVNPERPVSGSAYTPPPMSQNAWTPPATSHAPYRSPPSPMPIVPSGFAFKSAVTLTPAKDNGMHFGWDTLRRA